MLGASEGKYALLKGWLRQQNKRVLPGWDVSAHVSCSEILQMKHASLRHYVTANLEARGITLHLNKMGKHHRWDVKSRQAVMGNGTNNKAE